MIHSAEGKIKKTLIVANGTITLSPLHSEDLRRTDRTSVIKLPATFEEMENEGRQLFIAVKFNKTLLKEYLDTDVKDRAGKFLGYIPTINPDEMNRSKVFTKAWAQDVFDLALSNGKMTLYYTDGGDFFFSEFIKVALETPLLKCSFSKMFPKGGNLLFGGLGKIQYVLSTLPLETNYNDYTTGLASFYPAPLEVYVLHNDYPSRLKNGFYHTDLYVTIGGLIPKLNADKETVFFAEASSNIDATAVAANDWLKKVKLEFSGFIGTNVLPISLDTLPIYIVDSHDDCFILSYNNCHVENYKSGNDRIINIYFPDYRTAVKEYVSDKNEQDTVRLELLPKKAKTNKRYQAWDELMRKLNKRPTIKHHGFREMSFTDLSIIDEDSVEKDVEAIQNDLKTRLANHGITAHFIGDGYKDMMRNLHGGLHCVSKVIERG